MTTLDILINLWFFLWGLIWVIYLTFDMFVNGVNIVLPFTGKTLAHKKMMRQTYGPFWGGIEVWLILAVGATFAIFPHAFGEIFSSLYLVSWLIVFAIAVRGVFIEYMFKFNSTVAKKLSIWAVAVASFAQAWLFIILLNALFIGIAYGEDGNITMYAYNITNSSRFLAVFYVSMTVIAGIMWLRMKLEDTSFLSKLKNLPKILSLVAGVGMTAWLLSILNAENMIVSDFYPWMYSLFVLPVVALLFTIIMIFKGKDIATFVGSIITVATTITIGFAAMYPYVLPSVIDPEYGITIYEAASSQTTLVLMLVGALVLLPIAIGYQIWAQIRFGGKVTEKDIVEY